MKFTFKPSGVCSREYTIDLEDGIIKNIDIVGGCNGNLQGIKSLITGQKAEEVIDKLEGIKCGMKNTSCPDQIAKALKLAIEESK